MKALFIARSTLNAVRGGDTVQVYQTAEALRKLGVGVEIRLSGERIDMRGFDLVHGFNMIRPSDLLVYAENATVPFVLSPVYVNYSEYDRVCRTGLSGWLARHISASQLEYAKTVSRAVLGQDVIATKSYLWNGHHRSMEKLLARSAILLPNSESEARRVRTDLSVSMPYRVVPYAVSEAMFEKENLPERVTNRIICVGQIEGRKNQHALIEATRGLEVELLIAGKPSPNNTAYYEYCKRISHEGVRFLGFKTLEELRVLYNSSWVHALPSWFETAGLSSLEAGATGCNLVVGDRGDTRDYFEGYAEFCPPDDIQAIRKAVVKALKKPIGNDFVERIRGSFTWAHTAQATLSAYEEVLNR